MLRECLVSTLVFGFAVTVPIRAAHSAPQKKTADPAEMMRLIEEHTARRVDFDLCYPATEQEYLALGKNAVIMLTVSSVHSSELPLKSAYVSTKGVRIPLRRLAALDKRDGVASSSGSQTHSEQVSFYLLPIYLIKKDAELFVDFTGPRTAFGVTTFSSRRELESGVPPFIRLDDYDAPSDPDEGAIAALLEREYPEYFNRSANH